MLSREHTRESKRVIRRESNPRFLVHSQACSSRYTTDTISSSSTRTRTWNASLGPRDDVLFTIEPCERKVGESNPKPHCRGDCLARSVLSHFGYLPLEWTHRESNPNLQSAELVSSLWTMSPRFHRGPFGSRTRPSSLPRKRAAIAPTDHCVSVIPDGIEPSLSWMSARRLRRWTTGSAWTVTEVGVEPTITRLSTSPLCLFAYPAGFKLQILESNQASNLMRVG